MIKCDLLKYSVTCFLSRRSR